MADRNRGIIHDTQLDERAQAIRGAQTANFNSAERVGSLFADIIQYIDDHEEEWLDKGSGDGSVPSGMGGLINNLWVKANPAKADQILHWNGGSWEYIDTPSGGTGGGISLSNVWNSLSNNTGEFASWQIHAGHLSSALSAYVPLTTSWWGQTINNGTVTGNLSGNINSITFGSGDNALVLSYDSTNNALKLSKGTNGEANFYATGGVSALGYSSSGSDEGGGGITPAGLNDILTSINSSDAAVQPSQLTNGTSIAYNGEKWVLRTQTLGNLMNVAISNPQDGQGLIYDANNTQWINGNVASQGGATTLAALTDTTITPKSGGQLLYRDDNNNWINKAFSISNGSISFGGSNYTFITSHQSLSNYLKSSDARSIYATQANLNAATGKITTLEGYFTDGKANNADNLDGHGSEFFATAEGLNTTNGNVTSLTNRMTTAEGKITTAEGKISTLEGKFTSDKSAWGNPYLSNGKFQNVGSASTRADISYAGSVNMGYTLAMEYYNGIHDPAIYMKALKTDSNLQVLTLHNDDVNNTDHHLAIGYGTSLRAQLPIRFFGRNFLFNYTTNSSHTDSDNKIYYDTTEAMMIGPRNIGTTDNPVEEPAVYVRKHLMVGDGSGNYFPVTYDHTNKALCFSGNIYATGGVSALGFSSTANGGAMINGPLEVDGTANLKSDVTVKGNETVEGNLTTNDKISISKNNNTAFIDVDSTSGDLVINVGTEGLKVNDSSNHTIISSDSEGYIKAPSFRATSEINIGGTNAAPTIKLDGSDGLVIRYNNKYYALDIAKAINTGLFTEM